MAELESVKTLFLILNPVILKILLAVEIFFFSVKIRSRIVNNQKGFRKIFSTFFSSVSFSLTGDKNFTQANLLPAQSTPTQLTWIPQQQIAMNLNLDVGFIARIEAPLRQEIEKLQNEKKEIEAKYTKMLETTICLHEK